MADPANIPAVDRLQELVDHIETSTPAPDFKTHMDLAVAEFGEEATTFALSVLQMHRENVRLEGWEPRPANVVDITAARYLLEGLQEIRDADDDV